MGAPITELGCETSKLDVSSEHNIAAFQERMANRPIDLLLNVAGVMYPQDSDTLEKVNLTKLQKTFAVNAFGPLLLTQALLPSIELADRPLIAVMSSRVGSIGDNSTGGMYSYRSSKTAANMLFYNLSVDLKPKNITVLVLHPGIVKTNMDRRWKQGGNEDIQGAVEPEAAASDLWKVLMGKGLESTGKFFHRNGEELPW
jgi:NAD(P)-dependent dehydrogenase (short-subunit alcohol dehydrogenase family)